MSNFEVFPPKCEVLILGTAQREDVFHQQEKKKLSERCPTFKRFAELSKRTCAGLLFSEVGRRLRISKGSSYTGMKISPVSV